MYNEVKHDRIKSYFYLSVLKIYTLNQSVENYLLQIMLWKILYAFYIILEFVMCFLICYMHDHRGNIFETTQLII